MSIGEKALASGGGYDECDDDNIDGDNDDDDDDDEKKGEGIGR